MTELSQEQRLVSANMVLKTYLSIVSKYLLSGTFFVTSKEPASQGRLVEVSYEQALPLPVVTALKKAMTDIACSSVFTLGEDGSLFLRNLGNILDYHTDVSDYPNLKFVSEEWNFMRKVNQFSAHVSIYTYVHPPYLSMLPNNIWLFRTTDEILVKRYVRSPILDVQDYILCVDVDMTLEELSKIDGDTARAIRNPLFDEVASSYYALALSLIGREKVAAVLRPNQDYGPLHNLVGDTSDVIGLMSSSQGLDVPMTMFDFISLLGKQTLKKLGVPKNKTAYKRMKDNGLAHTSALLFPALPPMHPARLLLKQVQESNSNYSVETYEEI